MTIQRFNESFAGVLAESRKTNELFAELRSALGERPVQVRRMYDYLVRAMRVDTAFVHEVMEPYAIDIVTRLGAEVIEPTSRKETIALSIIEENPNFEGALYRAYIEDRNGQDIPYTLSAASLEQLLDSMDEHAIHRGNPVGANANGVFLVQNIHEKAEIKRNGAASRFRSELTREELAYLKRIYE